jgi:hypothetical protein
VSLREHGSEPCVPLVFPTKKNNFPFHSELKTEGTSLLKHEMRREGGREWRIGTLQVDAYKWFKDRPTIQ